ncbi:ROK family transcriptional regulator [Streptomyces sp. NPDC059881]|uniref:ROK family transcriptional regulator n=1 Tax=Streptomyces sp. NPDC059881 TaxID=3346986 RepID=UPI00364BE6C7
MASAIRGKDLAGLRKINAAVVLRALYARSPQTLSQLTAVTGLSRPTVEGLVETLSALGWVAGTEESPSGRAGGRPARSFRFRAEAGVVVGVDIGLHKIVLQLSDLAGGTLARAREDTDPEMTGWARLEFLRARLTSFLSEHAVSADRLLAIAVGVPGMVDATGRVRSQVIPDWNDVDLARRLADAFPCRILVENDANLAVVAEHWRGSAALVDDIVCILAGRRIAAGLLLSGRLHRGRRGGAGEMSTLPHLGLGPVHKSLHWNGERRPGESDIEALTRTVADKDPEALSAIDDFAQRLAPAIAALILAVDPDLVVLAGGISPLANAVIPSLTEQLGHITQHVPRVTVSVLGDEVVACGAARIALEAVNGELLDDPGSVRPLH